MKKKPIAIFDIDGTIFRSSLTIELLELMNEKGVVSSASMKKIRQSQRRWQNRESTNSYELYLEKIWQTYQKSLTRQSRAKIVALARRVLAEQKARTYVYTRDLYQKLRRTHILIAVSGSPTEIVEAYNKFLKFDYVFGTVFEVDNRGRYTGKILVKPSDNKKKFILDFLDRSGHNLKNSYGVGDTKSDAKFLSIVEHPIAFNPTRGFYKLARRRGWKIVVERKNVVYQL